MGAHGTLLFLYNVAWVLSLSLQFVRGGGGESQTTGRRTLSDDGYETFLQASERILCSVPVFLIDDNLRHSNQRSRYPQRGKKESVQIEGLHEWRRVVAKEVSSR